jgi:hypothetical protein
MVIGEIRQCWHDEIAALDVLQLHLESYTCYFSRTVSGNKNIRCLPKKKRKLKNSENL